MKIKANRKNTGRRPVKAAASGKIPYDLVSSLVILRDWAELNSDDYVSDEHKQLVDIADFLYNAALPADNLKPEAKKVYDKYGESYFDKVLEDVSAIDSQISHNNVNDLIEEYNDKVNEYMGWGVNASCNKKSVKSSSRQRRPVKASTSLSDPYIRIFITNLGKYNEGELVGEWVDLPFDDIDDLNEVLERIGINEQYEEYFITDSETNIPGLSIGEYDNIEELNDFAKQIDSLSSDELLIISARLDIGETFEEALAGSDDGTVYEDCYSDQDLGYAIVDMMGGPETLSKDTLEMYFDYDGFGRDVRISGSFHEVEPGVWVELY